MNRWKISKTDEAAVEELCRKSDLTRLCAKVLCARGYGTVERAAELLSKRELRSPFEIKDMQEACDAINEALDAGEKICIWGDYDCDGITSTAILYTYFREMGADISYYISERSEGYGMNEGGIRKLAAEGVRLIITVDNGITAVKEAELISELGMKLVITDHHQPTETLPKALAVVDVHREDDTSFFKGFCGAGIALKLVAAMEEGDYSLALEHFAEIAAIGTVADVVPLNDENRRITELGLFYLENTERPGLIALRDVCGMKDKKISSTTLAFTYAPRINASGRFGSPRQAEELLLAETEEEAKRLAMELNTLNTRRKEEEERILEEVYSSLRKEPEKLNKRVLVAAARGWHPGVIGIVAARLLETFGKPAFVITEVEGELRGSARAFGDFSVFEALEYSKEYLTKHGGHKSAGGFSLEVEKLSAFETALQTYAAENHPVMPRFCLEADLCIMPEDLTVENIESLEVLAPFGEGNPEPAFALVHARVEKKIPLADNKHTKLHLSYGGKAVEALIFRKSTERVALSEGDVCDLLVSAGINEWRGNKSVSLVVKDYRRSGIKQTAYFASLDAYERFSMGESLPANYRAALCPSREELAAVYRAIPKNFADFDSVYCRVMDISYGKFRIAADVFKEMGLCETEVTQGKIRRLEVRQKVDINSSAILKALKTGE